jgi:sporadic carbohydrate cluster protein (TIGR04323 family)
MLDNIQRHWDNATLDYDLEKYNFRQWAIDVIHEEFPQVEELETIHTTLNPNEIVKLQQHVQSACSRKDFMEMFDEFVQEYIPSKIENKKYMIQRQGTLRVVIPQQAKVGRRLHFHQGIFVGNGRGCRTIWTPLTKAEKTNTMWIMDLKKSREVTKQFLAEKWSLEKFEDTCIANSKPVELDPGQSHLFYQEHIHGNVNNEEGYTRVSMDMRILIEGEEYGRRLPGGFMRMPGDHKAGEEFDYSGKQFITYAGWNSEFCKQIPLPMQRATMEKYCEKYNIQYSSYEFENEHCDWQPGLEHYIKQKPDGIVLTSMYAMTDDKQRRNDLFNFAIENNVELHFANELCFLKNKEDLRQIHDYLNFAVSKKGPYSWQNK